ncbi:MAG: Gfo/Idh/MocA family oxidoreductase [Firmicutes bacterium]|nr:Gfo/Idh/MocA family oxidoreductase [Bacillota bacterium]
MNIGIIGTGARATSYAMLCNSDIRENIVVKALADINETRVKQFAEKYFSNKKMPELYTDYNQLLDDKTIEAVIICTPDMTHKEIALAALKQDKHILLEKPIATKIEDCVAIFRESLRHNKVFMMGFVLRYTSLYSKIKEIVSRGELGKLISIEAKETLGYVHAGSFFRRWHRFSKNNGGFLNAKCSHDMDILNWIAGVDPVIVFAAGSRTYFNKREDAPERCFNCTQKINCRYYCKREDFGQFSSAEDLCVFNADKDIVDHESVIIEYENGLTTCFTVSMLSSEANRTMVIFGSDATLNADFMRGTIHLKYINPANEIVYKFTDINSFHGGGDFGIFVNFIDAIKSGRHQNTNDARAGMMSSVIALSAEICIKEKRAVNLTHLIESIE